MGAVNDSLGLWREIIAAAKRTKDAELNSLILELQENVMNQNTEILNLRDKLSTYERSEDTRERLKMVGNVYQLGDDDTRLYCARCWGKDRKLNEVALNPDDDGHVQYLCHACSHFGWVTAEQAKRYRENQKDA